MCFSISSIFLQLILNYETLFIKIATLDIIIKTDFPMIKLLSLLIMDRKIKIQKQRFRSFFHSNVNRLCKAHLGRVDSSCCDFMIDKALAKVNSVKAR